MHKEGPATGGEANGKVRAEITPNIPNILDNQSHLVTPARKCYRTAWLKANTAEVQYMLVVPGSSLCRHNALWFSQQSLLTEIACTYTKISTSHVLTDSWPHKRATRTVDNLLLPSRQTVKPTTIFHALLATAPPIRCSSLHQEQQTPDLLELNLLASAREGL